MRRPFWNWLWQHRFAAAFGVLVCVSILLADESSPGSGGSGGGRPRDYSCADEINHLIWDIVLPPFASSPTCQDSPFRHSGRLPQPDGSAPLNFEPNLGQGGPGYDFVSSNGTARMLLSASGPSIRVPGGTIRASYPGSRADTSPEPLDLLPGRVNYLLGNVPSRWITDVPTYGRVRYHNVYPGIDVIYYGRAGQLEHDFVVSPGADPAAIRFKFEGADQIDVDSEGAIRLTVGGDVVAWKKPELYQEGEHGRRLKIEGRYRLERNGTVGLETGAYDPKQALVVDPVIAFSTYYGRGDSETATRVATDASGNIYYTGVTSDIIYPTFSSAFQSTSSGSAYDGDVLITKISVDGKSVLYTTHFGGNSIDAGAGIMLDSAGNIYVTGLTASDDFPVTKQIQPAPTGGASHCFVAKLNPAGTALVYSTLLGGRATDICTAIAVDSSGSAYVTGVTGSQDFPTRNGFQQTSHIGAQINSWLDGFVTKLSPDGASLAYSTFVGGSTNDGVAAIAVDALGNAYITGATTSTDFPVTTGVLQSKFGGIAAAQPTEFTTGDAFVMKLSATGSLAYSTYLGGSNDEAGLGIAIDAQGNAYVAGSTKSSNFPLKAAFQATYGGTGGELRVPAGDAFIAKLSADATSLVYSTYLGGSQDDRAIGIAVDSNGNAYVTGNTLSSNFPLSADAAQKAYAGQRNGSETPLSIQTGDAFFTQLGPVGTLVYSSYLGGFGADWGIGVALDNFGGVVIAGGTSSGDFPTSQGVAQGIYGGGNPAFRPGGDAFIVRFGAPPPKLSISEIYNAASRAAAAVAPGEIVTLKGIGIGPDSPANLQLDSSGGVAKLLSDTRILFDDLPAPVLYASAGQVNTVVPYAVSGRARTNVVVEYKGVRSPAASVPVAAVVPGLFAVDSSTGRGQGAILNQDSTYNSAQNPAAKGSIIQLFGTGEGVTTPAGVDGSIAATVFPKPVAPVAVMIGTTRIDTLVYWGAAPQAIAGLLQVNVAIPADAPSGSVPVAIIVGGVSSQTGLTVAIR